MSKIKCEFYTKREATDAMDKIKKHCISVKVSDYNYNAGSNEFGGEEYGNGNMGYMDYDSLSSRYSFGASSFTGFTGFPLIGAMGLGNMTMDWTVPYEYGGDMYGSYDVPAPKAILEAEVQDDKYSFIKERLYSYGAVSVYNA